MSDRLFARLRGLSPGKQALLERLLLRRATAAEESAAIPRRDPTRPCRLSPLQERVWFLDQLDPEVSDYVQTWAVRLRGPLDVTALDAAVNGLVQRHEVLRMAIRVIDGVPTQVFAADRPVPLQRIELGEGNGASEPAIQRALEEQFHRRLDPERDPLFRGAVIRLGEADHVFALSQHHLVSDGWTSSILLRELERLYAARVEGVPADLPPVGIGFGDVVAWQRERSRGPADDDIRWWSARLRDAPVMLGLPADRSRPARMSHRGATRSARLDPGLAARLRALARTEGATLYAVALAGIIVLLARYSGRGDVVVGVPIVTRDRPELEAVVGPLMDALPLRVDLAGVGPFRALVGRVQRGLADVYAHRRVPLDRLVELLRPGRGLDHTPVFQVMVGWREPGMLLESLRLPGMRTEPIAFERRTAKFDLSVLLNEVDGEIHCEIEYATDLFEAATIDRMLGQLGTVLAAAAANPAGPFARLPLVTPAERDRLLRDGNETAVAYPREASLPALFDAHRRRSPDAVALELGSERLTYGELSARSARLAARLRRHGVGPEVLVGVCLERSIELVAALLAILRAGGAYLPLDPADPTHRLTFLVADADAALVLTRREYGSRFAGTAARILCLDEADDGAAPDDAVAPAEDEAGGDRLAYVMYTSGSTGRPKGVEVPHRAVVRLLFGVDYAAFGPGEKILQVAPLGFDASTFEIWGALLHGGTCVLHPECLPTAAGLGDAVALHGVTTLFLTTALFNHVVDEQPPGLTGLRHLLTGGEAASARHVRRAVAALPATRIVHCYGPTEATTFTTCYELPRDPGAIDGTVPIGRPIGNTRVYLLDPLGEPVPVGVPGEIHIGGDGLARGYRRQPGLTAARFVSSPFGPGAAARLYRTGDLARLRPDGLIDFVGRRDDQLKVRGFRVEPAEVEAALVAHPAVASAAVVVRGNSPADRRLVAYVVPRDGAPPAASDLRAHLMARLPRYMVPSVFVPVVALPITASGKVDRSVLPVPEELVERPEADEPTRTPLEEIVAGIWVDVLGLARVGRREDFFELGGHSLLAIQVVARLRQLLERDVPASLLFEAPSVAELSARLEARGTAGVKASSNATPLPHDRPPPLALAQERIWHHARTTGGLGYTHTRAFQLRGAVDIAALQRSLTEIVHRHEILRTTYAVVGDAPAQLVRPPAPVLLPVMDLTGRPDAVAGAHRLAREAAAVPVDLVDGPILRPLLLRLTEAESWLMLTLHHIAYDAESLAVFFRELRLLYGAHLGGEPARLAGLPVRFVDYAAWQRERLRPGGAVYRSQLDYWTRWVSTRPGRLRLPIRRPAAMLGPAAGERALPVSVALWQRLGALARGERATVYLTVLTAFEVLLFHHTRQTDFVLGTYGTRRELPDLDDVMGCFVNLVVLRARIDASLTFSRALRRVRAETLDAYANQELPFEDVSEALPALRQAVPEIPVIFLHQRTRPDSALALAGLEVSRLPLPPVRMPWGLTVVLDEGEGTLRATFDAGRYDPEDVAVMLANLRDVVERAVANPALTVAQLAPSGARAPIRRRRLFPWVRPD